MATEIERKFLVTKSKLPKHLGFGKLIEQGYLSEKPEIRVRTIFDIDTTEGKAFLTIKSNLKSKSSALQRNEIEFPITEKDARSLLDIAYPFIIYKTRYQYQHNDLLWEIDHFEEEDNGFELWLAEIELKKANSKISLPRFIGKEVTHDPNYKNINLAFATKIK